MGAALCRRLEALLGSPVVSRREIGGGSINHAERVELADGRTLLVKTHPGAPEDMFPEEARGLSVLGAAPGAPPVPEVHHADAGMIVLGWIPPGHLDPGGWAQLGRALARMHETRSPRHGFEADNYLGSTRQPNPWYEDGVAFFGEQRLLHQVRLAVEAGRLAGQDAARIEAIVARLPSLLPADEPASLLHGDLWSGNVHPREDGVACILDPAAYFGWREADLAMTRLFGALPQDFYRAYEETWPLPAGAPERVDLFNLYHLLNHLNLFGGSYAESVRAASRKYA